MSSSVPPPAARSAFVDLALASFAALFFESLLVRWLPTSLYPLGYFKNCILIATFLGFGIGCATRYRADRLVPAFSCACAALVAGVGFAERRLAFSGFDTGELIWAPHDPSGVPVSMHALLGVMFAVAALALVPLGRLVGRHFEVLPPLEAYSVNLGASLAGIAAFVAIGFLRLGPDVWFALALLPLLWSVRHSRVAIGATLAGIVLVVGLIRASGSSDAYWSPYSKIELIPRPKSVLQSPLLETNNNGHQIIFDFSRARMAERPDPPTAAWQFVDVMKSTYESAYSLVTPDRVLIVGGGTGNEAAAALRRGAKEVHVVEIDPVIIDLGRLHHPERPYADPRVRVINDDARHYLATTDVRYDLVIFGFLDSTSHLSSLANIRLDNFVYTVESLDRAREVLEPDGLLQVTYYAVAHFVRWRLLLMIGEAFGQVPRVFQAADPRNRNVIFFVGPAAGAPGSHTIPALVEVPISEVESGMRLATDDWPYLYLREAEIGRDYLWALGLMGLISVLLVGALLPRRAGIQLPRSEWGSLFLLGVGFMLLETCTVTRAALIFGSTWLVTQLSIALVLLGSLAANQWVLRRPGVGLGHAYALLGVGLIVNASVDLDMLQGLGALRLPAAAVLVYLPMLGSSLAFAVVFRSSRHGDQALGANILGAVAGGGLEYVSLILGTRKVYLLALAVFLAALAVHRGAGGGREVGAEAA